MKLKLKQKDYSLQEAFGPGFPANQHIMGFENIGFPFVPRRNPLWHWDRDVLRDLMQWWQDDGSSDGMFLFGPHGSGKSAALRQFCSGLQIPCYAKGMHPGVEFDELVIHVGLGGGSTLPSYSWLTLAMGAEGYPGFFCANEIDRAKPGMLVALHEVLDGEPLNVQLGGLEPVMPSPYFKIAATGNTAMSGDPVGLYPSAKRQDVSFVDRFVFCRVHYLKDTEECALIERVVPSLPKVHREKMVEVANTIRASFMGDFDPPAAPDNASASDPTARQPEQELAKRQLPLTMSTRMLLRWARKAIAFRSFKDHGVNPIWYALDRVLLHAADSMPEVRIAIKEMAVGILGPDPAVS